jgi:hypothetical protein
VDCCAVHQDPVSLEVGEGDPEGPTFEPFEPGAELLLHYGPQGGYHVYLNIRTTGICPNEVRWTRVLRAADDDEVQRLQHSPVSCLVDDGAGGWVLPAAPVSFICPATTTGLPMNGAPFDMDVSVTELETCAGDEPRTASTTVRFVPVCAADDDFCRTDSDEGCALWDGS